MAKPILMVVDDHAQYLKSITEALARRYAADYEIRSTDSARDALTQLDALVAAGRHVAAVLAKLRLSEMSGIDFLEQAQASCPQAKRVLRVSWLEISATESFLRATTLGIIINFYDPLPANVPDERFHHFLTGLLADWSSEQRMGAVFVQIVGDEWAPQSHEIRYLFDRYRIPYHFFDVNSQEGRALLDRVERTEGPFPLFIFLDGRVLAAPSLRELGSALGAQDTVKGGLYDLAIVGGGPAGLSAAVNAASEGLRTIVVEREAVGGQASSSSLIRNYPGFPAGISGAGLTNLAQQQAYIFGTEFYLFQSAVELRRRNGQLMLRLSDGTEIASRAVILAMGAAYRRLNIPRLEALVGSGVYYGGGVTEALGMSGEDVFVVGAGNSAGQTAIYLAKYAARVTLLARGGTLVDSMSDYLIREIDAADNIDVRLYTEVVEGRGDGRLEGLVLRDNHSGATETVSASALFVFIGAQPHTDWLPDDILRDEKGFIRTGQDLIREESTSEGWRLPRSPFLLETSMPGVFAIGDVRHHSVKRVASAVGEGGIAIQMMHQYLGTLHQNEADTPPASF
ncbi:MAG: FAD-dependent oxidoreductase [Chloroflexi bacterium]|nr:FAD-dependent oxidoreductase [Chloroflexota bacterium]